MASRLAAHHCCSVSWYQCVPWRISKFGFHSLLTDSSHIIGAPKRVRCSRTFCFAKPFVVAEDEKYGNKQVISVTPRLYDYILSNLREPEILRELREETANMRGSQMQVSPDQAQLLAMLVQIIGAKRCIEVGVYTGYSSLAVALVLPESGCLVACERDANALEIARKYYEKARVSHKVNVKHGLAVDTLELLLLNGEACSYDFAFVDAEKRMNQEYFELLLKLVRAGGVIVIDNVLWHGKVADPMINDAKTLSIRNFNKNLMEDNRVSISMLKYVCNSACKQKETPLAAGGSCRVGEVREGQMYAASPPFCEEDVFVVSTCDAEVTVSPPTLEHFSPSPVKLVSTRKAGSRVISENSTSSILEN